MTERPLKEGQRVEVTGKDVKGVVAYVGTTLFSSGKWIGVILDEPKGKNNGTVQGRTYFQCKDNHGMFVRQSQLTLLDESGAPVKDYGSTSSTSTATTPDDNAKTRPRLSSVKRKTEPTAVRRKSSPAQAPRTRSDKSRNVPGRKPSSRLSLASSRSQSEFAKEDSPSSSGKDTGTPSASEPTSKRASFIEKPTASSKQGVTSPESVPLKQSSQRPRSLAGSSIGEDQTGFVETLKPQYTPGPAMISPGAMSSSIGTVEERLTNLQQQQEIDNLQTEVRDLQEKLETLKLKRLQDAEKLKEHEKVKLQLEQLLEFKARIMESQAMLQRDLQRAKQEAREAVEAREAHAEEMADLAETVEMATLDKEMAEEKAETLQLELEQAKEKIEEMTLDLEILKAEMSERSGGEEGGKSSYEVKQLEQQNLRLRETLVRMRDLSAHEKHEFQKLQKEFEQKKSEVAELARTKEKLSSRIEEMENQVADLQEQVDAALGAEEMVQQLVDAKMNLEEKVKELQEAVADLEELQDMNEQLQENSREVEVELREELDLARAATREAIREKEAAFETIADREQTIIKFRELVKRQHEQCVELQQRLERESSKPVTAMPEILDFKKMFTETKAHTKAIDLELRQMDVQQSSQHVKYLAAYMPDTFMNRGGDHDAVLVLLLVPRMLWKADILLSQVRDKFPNVEKIDRAAILKGHTVEQFSFKSRFSHFVHSLQMILHQFTYSLNACSPETFLKVGTAYPEMAAQEKAVDAFVDLLRRDQLDENVMLDALEKCVTFFSTMFPVLLGDEMKSNQTNLLADAGKALSSACDAILTDATSIKTLMESGQETGEMNLLLQHLSSTSENVLQLLKQIRRRLPQDHALSKLGFSDEIAVTLMHCCQHATRICKVLQQVLKGAIQQIAISGEPDFGVPHEKIREFAYVAIDSVYEDDRGPIESMKASMGLISGEVAKLNKVLQDNEYELAVSSGAEEKPVPPIVLRAQAIKKELEETKNLKHKLEARDADIKELKKALKLKQEEFSEMSVRKEFAEKKLGNSSKEYEMTIEKLQRKLDDFQQLLKRKEKEHEASMDHLQADIDSLETERRELKDKLKSLNKKAINEGFPRKTAVATQEHSLMGPISIISSAGAGGNELLLQEQIQSLRRALSVALEEKWKLEAAIKYKRFLDMKPLKVPKRVTTASLMEKVREKEADNWSLKTAESILKKAVELQKEIYTALATPKVVDISKRFPGSKEWLDHNAPAKHLANEAARLKHLREKVAQLESEAAKFLVKRKTGGKIEADFAVFPTVEMKKALEETRPVVIGKLKLPRDKQLDKDVPDKISLFLSDDQLKLLHKKLLIPLGVC
ncbi:dynactin subunit 1 isoform X4 [Schistocerca gregaria]|nr:dynactin subunit 1 isoform X4 [Schistocerca gregaria]